MKKTFCDRCGKEIDCEKKWGCIDFEWRTKKNPYGKISRRQELCQPCFTALESFLNNK